MGAVGMNGAGYQLFTDAALSQDQDGMGTLRDFGQNAVKLVHLRAAAIRLPRP